MLERLTERHGHTGSTPGDLRLLFIVLVGYSGFLRISELLSMKTNHIQIMPEGMSVFLPKRKNDQFRAGNTIHIARTGKPTCPVAITERLLEALPGDRNGCLPVVRRLKRVRGLQTFHELRGISYTTAKDLLKRKLGVFFDDLRHLGTHSLRSGGFPTRDARTYRTSPCRLMGDGNAWSQRTNISNLQLRHCLKCHPVCLSEAR